ncbi:lipoprotein [Streptomyces thermocarboxydovorans]|uniref:Lipoprotein n=1 Tax=Streptomyces thermocarboxydovorans TaxID=59298 RepID=A0ABP3SFR3_9ACTN
MKPTSVRRTALAASAAALALLVTACGGDGDKADEGKGASESTAAAAPAAKALTAAELEKVALAQSDVKEGKVAAKVPARDDIAADQVKTDDEACLPLARAQAGVAQGEPAATTKRSWTGEPKKPSAGTDPEEAVKAAFDVSKMLITLASYEDGGAEKAMKDLSTAAEKCAAGFKATTTGEKMEIAEVAATAAPKGGDEGAAITLTLVADEGLKAPNKLVAVRKGSTLVTFSVVNLAAMAEGKDFEVPADVVNAQVAKLG